MIEAALVGAIAVVIAAITGIIPWGAICLAAIVGVVLYCDKK